MAEKTDKLYIGHRQRLRERFIVGGYKAFQQYELLELLLTYSIQRRDVKPVAKILVQKFGSISKVFDAEYNELKNITGIGDSSAILINLFKGLSIEYHVDKVKEMKQLSSPGNVYSFLDSLISGSRDEKFVSLYLNTKNKLIDYEISSEGVADHAVVYPRKIIRKALELNATSLIIAHNHPSGEIAPSKEDISLTESIKSVCSTMDISLVDHLIIGDGSYYSFCKNNML
ncbi:MAG TPA: DNA repair protein RadC [Victivallales bacterium]|nr:DNA repair protein RadC [Victivallales bacterium]